MGQAKRMLEDQLEHGFSLGDPWRGVCPGCIDDDALKLFVSRHQAIDGCGFCGGAGPAGLRLDDLFKYMAGCLGAEWDGPGNGVDWDGREGGWQGAEVIDSWDLLGELDEPLGHDDLRLVFVAAFDREWCQRHPYSLTPDQRLSYSWARFARYVKEEARYLFLHTGRSSETDPELVEPAAMLEELGMSIVNSGLVRRLPAGTALFRARQHGLDETLSTPAELGSPPRARAGANRMNPAGIAMFYGADDAETALAELRPEGYPRGASVARWSTARELRYLDLVAVGVPSIFDAVARVQRPWRLFLRRFAAEVAQPVVLGAGEVDYVPTQIVTEFVRHVLVDANGEHVQAIRYRSAARDDGVSWVVFVDEDGCVEASPGWEREAGHCLGLDPASIRLFRPSWAEVSS